LSAIIRRMVLVLQPSQTLRAILAVGSLVVGTLSNLSNKVARGALLARRAHRPLSQGLPIGGWDKSHRSPGRSGSSASEVPWRHGRLARTSHGERWSPHMEVDRMSRKGHHGLYRSVMEILRAKPIQPFRKSMQSLKTFRRSPARSSRAMTAKGSA
jgi:hypothetical protein